MSHQPPPTGIPAAAGGCFTRSDAIAAGFSAADVRRLIRSGAWVQLRRGVFAERVVVERAHSSQLRHRLEAAAVVRALAGPVVLSGRTAAVLHRLPVQPDGLVHVTRRPGNPGRWRTLGVDVHEAALPEDHITDVDGFLVTSAARTVVDLARAVAFRDAVTAADYALHQDLTHKRELQAVVDFCRSWPRIRPAQHVITFADQAAESPCESLARVVLHEGGVPRPQTQVVIGDEWFRYARVDFAWPEHGTVLEADGLLKYRDPSDLQREKLRQEHLEELGLQIVRVTWRQLIDEPARCCERVTAAFRRAANRPRPQVRYYLS